MRRTPIRSAGALPRRAALSALLLAAVLAAACSGGERDHGREIGYYLSAYPASLSLLGKTDLNTEIVAVQITDSLVQYDDELVLRPRVAESWILSDERRTITFRLRPGVRWHDGEAVTADDVVFTVNKVLDPSVENTTYAPLFQDLESITAPDALTVEARYSVATPDLLEGWRVPLLPRHVAGRDEDLMTGAYADHPIGCGPFRFVRAVPDREIVLEANQDYWDGPPAVDRLVLKVFRDQRTAYHALLAGDLDVMTVTTSLYEEARRSPRAGSINAMTTQRLSVWVAMFQQDGSNPFFADPRVRQAMLLALDRESFIESVMYGQGLPAATTYHPATAWADPQLEPRPFDPRRAAELLDEAGWIDRDGDGLRDRDGQPFRFTLMVSASAQKLADHLAAWKQESWAELGLQADIERIEWQALRERRNAGQFQAVAYTLHFTPNPDQYVLYHSSAREGGINYFGFADAEVDRLLELGRSTFDPEQRMEVYRRLQRRLYELEALGSVFYFTSPVLHDRRLAGIVSTPIGISVTTRGPRLWHWIEGTEG